MNIISEPKIDTRSEQVYMGIRTIVSFSDMSRVITKMSEEMIRWIDDQSIETAGLPFLRYHVIDMRGSMDITFGIPVIQTIADDGSITAGTLLAGRYVSLIYMGDGIDGNKALIEWARGNGLEFDRWDTAQGDNFRCRYETFLTDTKLEPRENHWEIEVAIKLADV